VTAITTATGYTWNLPSGYTITSGSGTNSITVQVGTNPQSGTISVTPYSATGTGCTSSITVSTSDCSNTNYYQTKNNYTGDWASASSWVNKNETWAVVPPPSNPVNSQTLTINGYITLNGTLRTAGTQQYICDTLVVTGDFLADNPTLTVGSSGLLIVLGDYKGLSGTVQNGGRVVVVGDFEKQGSNTMSTGTYYLFDPTPTITNPVSGFTYGDETTLQTNDPDLYDFLATLCSSPISAGTIAADQSICGSGDPVAFTEATSATTGSTYQWYSSTTSPRTWAAISSATSATYDPSTLSATTYFVRKAKKGFCSATSNELTVTIKPLPNLAGQQTSTPVAYCKSKGVPITISGTGLADGSYTVNYTLTGANAQAATDASMTVSGGSKQGTFLSSVLSNLGSTTVTINSVTLDGCTTNTVSGDSSIKIDSTFKIDVPTPSVYRKANAE
jgi:hypothetical protein